MMVGRGGTMNTGIRCQCNAPFDQIPGNANVVGTLNDLPSFVYFQLHYHHHHHQWKKKRDNHIQTFRHKMLQLVFLFVVVPTVCYRG